MLFLAVLMNQNVENSKRYLCDSLYVFSCYCCSRTRATLSSSLHFRELQPGMFLRLGTVATPLAPLQHHDRQHIRQLPDYGITHTQGTVNRRQCNEKTKQRSNKRMITWIWLRCLGNSSPYPSFSHACNGFSSRQTSLRHPRAARPCSCTTEQPHIMPQLLLFV